MIALHGGSSIPVVDPAAADGVFGLLWLVIALPLAGAAVLLIGGKYTDKWGHLLGTLLPIGSFAIRLEVRPRRLQVACQHRPPDQAHPASSLQWCFPPSDDHMRTHHGQHRKG